MPLDGLAELGVPIVEDAAQAFGAEGVARTGVALDVQLLPDQEPLRRSATAASSPPTTRSSPTGSRCCASTARARRRSSRRSATTRASTSSRRPCCGSSSAQLDGWNAGPARRGRALRGARPRRALRAAGRRARPRLPHVRRPLARARPARRGARGGRDRPRVLLRDAAPPPAGASLPRLQGGRRCPETERAARENLALPMWAGIPAETQERVVARDPRGRGGARVIPINRHRIWQLVADAAAGRARVVARLRAPLRQRRSRSYYETLFRRVDPDRRRDQARRLRLLRLLQPLVALRLDARHVADRPRRHARVRRSPTSPSTSSRRCTACGCRARSRRSTAALLALVAGVAAARADADRAAAGGGLVARGKEVLVVGAGDAGQLVIREMQRNPQLGYTPIGFVDDDPRKKNLRIHGVRVLGTTDELPHILRDNRPDEVLIAIPSASGEARQRIVTITREGNVPVKTLPGLYELISGERDLAAQIREVQVEDVLGREPVEVDLEASPRTSRDADRARHRRRRLDRLGALPPDRPRSARSGSSSSTRPRRRCSRSSASSSTSAASPPSVPGARRLQEPRRDARGLRALPARRRLPRRRLQARAADGGEPARGGAQQRARDAGRRRGRGRVRRRALRARLDRQGGQPEDGDGPVEGALRVDRRGLRRARGRRDALRRRALRQRARLVGQRDPDLPPPDREGRPGHASPTRR